MCLICDRIEMIKNGTNPYFVRELRTGYAVIGDVQHFRGYTLFLYKDHAYTELFQMEEGERALFMKEMALVAEAAARAFKPDKMNYELLGMGDAHLHWHLFPRRAGDIGTYGNGGKGPVWWWPMEKMYAAQERVSEEDLEILKRDLGRALDELIG